MLEICTKMAKYAQNMQENLLQCSSEMHKSGKIRDNLLIAVTNKVHFKVFWCKTSPVVGQNFFVSDGA